MMASVHVSVPATTANLGPGFDALGLALGLWNEAEFTSRADGRIIVKAQGEGAGSLPTDQHNAIAAAALTVFSQAGQVPPGMQINCLNRIPLGSGLGSSAAAVLTGMLGANALLGSPFNSDQILAWAIQAEGHPDNVAPALLGGLVVSITEGERVLAHKLTPRADRPAMFITLILPEIDFPTHQARAALPSQVAHKAAVFNIGRAVLTCEALLTGNLDLLGVAMEDQLHQPFRLPLIPGAQAALAIARQAGACAAALSGAGPSLVAFLAKENPAIGQSMAGAFQAAGVSARIFHLRPSEAGAQVIEG